MKHYAGLDVSLEETSVVVIDARGGVVRDVKVAREPGALSELFHRVGLAMARIGLEAGPLSHWLCAELRAAGLHVVCLESRQVKAALAAQKNKTDRNAAYGIAQIVRTGWYQEVHIKSRWAQEVRVLRANRRVLSKQRRDLDNEVRGTLRNFGLKVGKVGRGKGRFEARVRELVARAPNLRMLVEPMLVVRKVLIAAYERLHGLVMALVREPARCRQFMTTPGGDSAGLCERGPASVQAIGWRTFRHDAPHVPIGRDGLHRADLEVRRRAGADRIVRGCRKTRVKRSSSLRDWGLRVAKNRGLSKAKIAVARRLAVILHRMWMDGTDFQPVNKVPVNKVIVQAA